MYDATKMRVVVLRYERCQIRPLSSFYAGNDCVIKITMVGL